MSWTDRHVAESLTARQLLGMMAALAALAGCQDTAQLGGEPSVIARQSLSTTASFRNGVNGYDGTSDASIREASANANDGSSSSCEADGVDASGKDRSCLVRWDVSSIPTGSTITSASLTFRVTNATTNTYSIYGTKRGWQEASVSWNQAASGSPWQTPGATGSDDRGEVVGSLTGSGSRTVALNAAGVALVQSWVNGGTNAGLILASSSNSDGIAVASSEHATVSYRPQLSVVYDSGVGGASGAGNTTTGGTSGPSASSGGTSASSGGTSGPSASSGGSTFGGTMSGGASSTAAGSGSSPAPVPEPNLLVAFLGDQGDTSNADAVLNLVKAEGAAAVVHNGDFDYLGSPAVWNARIDRILGAEYPYFAVVGNHDAAAWNGSSGYASYINARLSRVPKMQCNGDIGVKATCRFRGLFMVQSCVGTSELTGHGDCSKNSSEQSSFIRAALAGDDSLWSLCLWHKNQNDMQIGTKGDEVGWNAYRECMSGGAIVSTAHEHSYSRTLGLTDLGNRAAGHGLVGAFDDLLVAPGQTFVFVSGLGGQSVRDYDAASHGDDTWWAAQYAANRWMKSGVVQSGTGTYGALFIRFHVDGNPRGARGYFKDVNGRVVDEFNVQVP